MTQDEAFVHIHQIREQFWKLSKRLATKHEVSIDRVADIGAAMLLEARSVILMCHEVVDEDEDEDDGD